MLFLHYNREEQPTALFYSQVNRMKANNSVSVTSHKRGYKVFTTIADILILALSFLFMVWLKPASLRHYLPTHLNFFIILALLWVVISLAGGKLHRGKIINLRALLFRTVASNTIALAIAIALLYSFQQYGYSRMVILGTAGIATLLELITGTIFLAFQKAVLQDYQPLSEYRAIHERSEKEEVGETDTEELSMETISDVPQETVEALTEEWGSELATGILNIAGGKLNGRSRILSTTTLFNIRSLPEDEYSYLANLHRINDIRDIDRFTDALNHKLSRDGHILCCVETKNLRKKRILKKFPPVINYIFYSFDFIIKRVLPKIRFTRWLWLLLTRGNNVVISRAEALGRISRAGFEITTETYINNLLFIEGRKKGAPLNIYGKNYGILITLPRVGRNGDIINVYKVRTMHPYSEYIQDYVYNRSDLQEGGKFNNDFRITSWGKFCRRVWIDELPMIINFFKGEMKIVGVRPLSKQYFSLYSPELRERRIRFKPGLVPPYYYDMPRGLEEIEASEIKYLARYEKQPLLTDLKYFFVCTWNIIFRDVRSG